ncbi:MAG TPA: hypothetical protein VFS12_09585 [Terriglobia bacterium]|nr:hypothetical protein [Terriglobia bacterium]
MLVSILSSSQWFSQMRRCDKAHVGPAAAHSCTGIGTNNRGHLANEKLIGHGVEAGGPKQALLQSHAVQFDLGESRSLAIDHGVTGMVGRRASLRVNERQHVKIEHWAEAENLI